jgi:hypothetical protein
MAPKPRVNMILQRHQYEQPAKNDAASREIDQRGQDLPAKPLHHSLGSVFSQVAFLTLPAAIAAAALSIAFSMDVHASRLLPGTGRV